MRVQPDSRGSLAAGCSTLSPRRLTRFLGGRTYTRPSPRGRSAQFLKAEAPRRMRLRARAFAAARTRGPPRGTCLLPLVGRRRRSDWRDMRSWLVLIDGRGRTSLRRRGPTPVRVVGHRSTGPFSALRQRPRPWAGFADAYGCCARRECNGHARRRPGVAVGGSFRTATRSGRTFIAPPYKTYGVLDTLNSRLNRSCWTH